MRASAIRSSRRDQFVQLPGRAGGSLGRREQYVQLSRARTWWRWGLDAIFMEIHEDPDARWRTAAAVRRPNMLAWTICRGCSTSSARSRPGGALLMDPGSSGRASWAWPRGAAARGGSVLAYAAIDDRFVAAGTSSTAGRGASSSPDGQVVHHRAQDRGDVASTGTARHSSIPTGCTACSDRSRGEGRVLARRTRRDDEMWRCCPRSSGSASP